MKRKKHMKKRKSRALGNEFELGRACIRGVHELGGKVGIVANTEAVMAPLVDAALHANTHYQFAIGAGLEATKALRVQFNKAAKFIRLVRDNLKPAYGTRYSETWNKVGFINRTLNVPLTMKQRASLLKAIEQFFVTLPEMEIPNVMTRAMAAALHADFTAALEVSTNAKVDQRQKKTIRDRAMAAMRVRIQALRNELKPLLAADDPRWMDFGFGVPADVHVTAAPEGVELTQDAATGRVVASWGHTVNTDRFRIYKRVTETDTESVLAGTTANTSFDLGTFASGAHVEVQVTAINSAGESVPSEVVGIVVSDHILTFT